MPIPSDRFARRLADIASATESALEAALSDRLQAGEIARPARLVAAMRHATLGGGKRLRAFLVVETAQALGRAGDGVMRAAAAVECLHAYSLAHDDLPAMDDDALRRGRPTVHRAFDEATAILAGDGLLTLAFDMLADARTDDDAAIRAGLVLALARGAGIGGMVGGQMLDLAAEGRFGGAPTDDEGVRRIQEMKTGALIRASAAMGAILGRATAEQRAALDRFAARFGAAFQIADDLLDVESSAEALGKAARKDDAKGKATLVNRLGAAGARRELSQITDEAIAALSGFGSEGDLLRDAARFAAERTS
jgi:farnesyl diphosphate synthase